MASQTEGGGSMQLGGIDTDHGSQNHQVTGCLHEHTTAQKGGALASAASQVAQLKQQEQQQTTQLSLAGLMEKTLEKGRAILRGIWGTSGEKGESAENGRAELAQPATTKNERDIHAAEVAGTVGRKTLEHQTQVNPYFQPVEHTAVPDVTPVQKLRTKIKEAASQLADHLPGRFFGSQGKNSLQTKQEQAKEDLRKRSRYKKDETEIDCILTDESYLMDSYDRKGEYTQLTTKK